MISDLVKLYLVTLVIYFLGLFRSRKEKEKKYLSCLDLSIVSRELWPYVNKLVIDRDKKFTPARPINRKGKYRLIYTDHFSTLLSLKDLPRRQKEKVENRVMWNLSKLNGWEEYKKVTNENSEKLLKIVENNSYPIDVVMEKFEKVMN